jgi:hypothetical protein
MPPFQKKIMSILYLQENPGRVTISSTLGAERVPEATTSGMWLL